MGLPVIVECCVETGVIPSRIPPGRGFLRRIEKLVKYQGVLSMANASHSNRSPHPYNASSKLVINHQQVGGLIVCYEHHAEFLGPGAIAHSSTASPHTHVVPLGNPIVLPVDDPEAIAAAYRQRQQWLAWLARLTGVGDAKERCRRLIQGLEGLFSRQDVSKVPDETLALLIGVFPCTVTVVRAECRRRLAQMPAKRKRSRPGSRSKSVFAVSGRSPSPNTFSSSSSRPSGLSKNPKRRQRNPQFLTQSAARPSTHASQFSQTIA